jgi:hypothetical protein
MAEQNFILDALVYTSIQNIISPTQFRNKNGDYWNLRNNSQTTAEQLDETTSISDAFANFRNQTIQTDINVQNTFNELLSNSTIKRACCLGYNSDPLDTKNFEISVKIPYVNEVATKLGATQDILFDWENLGYIKINVKVPKSMCPSEYYRPSRTNPNAIICDKFMRVYCENAKEMYNIDVSGTYDEDEFMRTTPECGCFSDRLKNYGGNAPPLCYSPRCSFSDSVYVDQNTRTQGGCDVKQCVAILNLSSEAALGGQSKIEPVTSQSCFSSDTQTKYDLPVVEPPQYNSPRKFATQNPKNNASKNDVSNNDVDKNTIAGLSKPAFYGIIGGITGLLLLIIVVVIIVMMNNKKIKNKRYRASKS